jgi:hypothetical protein
VSEPHCPSDPAETCAVDRRRPLVRVSRELAGIDYVEVYPDGLTLCVHFFGTLPRHLDLRHVVITGGARIRDITITDAQLHEHGDGDVCLMLTVDKTGDFSTYCVCLSDPVVTASRCSFDAPVAKRRQVPKGIDPRYACAPFTFCLDPTGGRDCKPEPCPPTPKPPLPPIDYLARDYDTFRRLILDRIAQTMPQWRERHAPDLGITIAEALAYTADHLSYQVDAVAMEAFLRTARRRISVRRHARLVDYLMQEGCNARAWVTIASETDLPDVSLAEVKFVALSGDDARRSGGLLDWHELDPSAAQIYEPIAFDARTHIDIVASHSEIEFYTWRRDECCLPAGSTHATLYDSPGSQPASPDKPDAPDPHAAAVHTDHDQSPPWTLKLKAGDVLVIEETRGCDTGSTADADPARRHVVRLTRATRASDPLTKARIWDIEWHRDDALPFDVRLSVRTGAPECKTVSSAVARGNVVLVDHGLTVDETNPDWVVGVETDGLCCVCDGGSTEQRTVARRLMMTLGRRPVTHADPIPDGVASARALVQRDPRMAQPSVGLDAPPPPNSQTSDLAWWAYTYSWHAVRDLLSSGGNDHDFVVEIDDEGLAQIRFGDGVNGRQPRAGERFAARYRLGNGPMGNVGRDAIRWLAFTHTTISGATIRPRNPLPATGGLAPESIDSVKRRAPSGYTRVLERAVAADDYARLAEDDPRVQGAFGELVWTGSWYEADVAIDPLAGYAAEDVAPVVIQQLERARRIGHDLGVVPARLVPLDIALSICVSPGYLRGDVEDEARNRLSNRILSDGTRGLFHPDDWRFGADVAGSRIIAAIQAIDGVTHVEFTRFARLNSSDADAAQSKDENLIAIAVDEIAVLEGDPNFPEHGRLTLDLRGGR